MVGGHSHLNDSYSHSYEVMSKTVPNRVNPALHGADHNECHRGLAAGIPENPQKTPEPDRQGRLR
jgi:hypothetical protein